MTRCHAIAAGALLCVLTLSTARALTTAVNTGDVVLQDHKHRGIAFRLHFERGEIVYSALPDTFGAPKSLRYRSTAGEHCELFFADDHPMIGRARHAWLHRSQEHDVVGLLDESGQSRRLNLPPSCPVLAHRP